MPPRKQAYWTMKNLSVYHFCWNCPEGSEIAPENLGRVHGRRKVRGAAPLAPLSKTKGIA